MKRTFDTRLRTLEDQHFFSFEDAHEVVRLLSEAAHQHVSEAQHSRLCRSYARTLVETFRYQDWLTAEGLQQFIESLLAVTLSHCTVDQRRGMRTSLETLQHQGVNV